jgi:glycosyltransferase involved in cell wall biosynthesis
VNPPFFSICIPQYNRTSFLIEACRRLKTQTFDDFEVCISDDRSTDGREEELKATLDGLGLRYTYNGQKKNSRYDANLRSAIGLASGRYCILMGNDDCLATPRTLAEIHAVLSSNDKIGVAITNYRDFDGPTIYRRVRQQGILAGGPALAVSRFRNFSFVSGVILRTDCAQRLATDEWDGSEMYQMYLGCRILAEGHSLAEIDLVAVLLKIQIPGEQVDSYATRPRLKPCPLIERRLPLGQMGRLVVAAVAPFAGRNPSSINRAILVQLLIFPYSFWILEYRRVQSWKFAAGICLGMRPRNICSGVELSILHAAQLRVAYIATTAVGLLVPLWCFDRSRKFLYTFAKQAFQGTQ